MSAIKLTIDGRPVEVEPGTTILEAARKLGIDIPTFCHDPELAPNGACRICVVEVERARALVASIVRWRTLLDRRGQMDEVRERRSEVVALTRELLEGPR